MEEKQIDAMTQRFDRLKRVVWRYKRQNQWIGYVSKWIITGLIVEILVSCVGSPIHSTVTYNKRQEIIKRNNKNILRLKIDISQDEVQKVMSNPERSEGYPWGAVWLYRTAMTSGTYGTADPDFTPAVFDKEGILIGWGSNFYTEHVKRYEIKLKTE